MKAKRVTISYIPAVIPALFFLFSIISGCTDRIEIRTDDAPVRLVIYGYITTDQTSHSVKITRSTGYFATTAPPGISEAEVTITCGDEVFILTEDPDEPGLYLTQPDVMGVEGKTYTLTVNVDFEGEGRYETYTATSFLPYHAEVEAVSTKKSEIFDDRIEVLYFGRLPEFDENYLSFHVYRNDIAVNDSLIDFFVLDDEYINGKEIKGVSCFYLDQEEEKTILAPGDKVTLRVDAITKEYYEFLGNAQSEVYGNNPIFSGPPANIGTNIQPLRKDNDIPLSGFFTAFSSDRASCIHQLE